jgi:hypothetical protein
MGARIPALLAVCAACGPAGREVPDANILDAASTPDAAIDVLGMTYVYANTPESLYRVDPDTLMVTKIGDFIFPTAIAPGLITDIAIDKNGIMLGVTNDAVYRIDSTTARLTLLSDELTGGFNGLSFVPAALVGESGADILVGTRADDGLVFRIEVTTGHATSIGDMGDFHSSGDLVSVSDFGTAQIATGVINGSFNRLVRLEPPGFAGTAVGSTGFIQLWGLAYWKNRLFGFTYAGEIIVLDQTTGKGEVVQSGGPQWFGAAVTTSAPVL